MATKKSKFHLGSCVAVKGTKVRGVISHVGSFDEHLGQYRYKVQTAHNRVTWNENSLRKIACRR